MKNLKVLIVEDEQKLANLIRNSIKELFFKVAIAKDGNGLCVLGIPTWLTVGNYETQGLVQNIRNVIPK